MIRVETKQNSVHIADLGLFVTSEDPLWLTPEQYKTSLVIKKLEQMGAIVCSHSQRSRTMSSKKLPPPQRPPVRSVVRSRPNKTMPVGTSNSEQQINVEEAVKQASEQAAEKAAQAVLGQILANLPAQQQSPANQNIEGLEEMVQRAVMGALGNMQFSTPVSPESGSVPKPQKTSGPEEPIYIPSNIVDKDVKGNVNVKSETSTSEGLDDAANALKELRKSKPKKKRK